MTKGERLKKLRLERDITQDEVSKAIGVAKQTLFKYESDIITNIPSDKVEQLALYYGVSPAFLMGWEDDEPTTIAAHKDAEEWTEEEIESIELFKELLRQKRNKK